MPVATTTGTEGKFQQQALEMAVQAAPSATATAAAGAATLNAGAGVVTSETLTTAAAATYTLTLTNSFVATTDICDASVWNGTNTTGNPAVCTVTPGAGIVTIVVQNVHASVAFGGTLKLGFSVIKMMTSFTA